MLYFKYNALDYRTKPTKNELCHGHNTFVFNCSSDQCMFSVKQNFNFELIFCISGFIFPVYDRLSCGAAQPFILTLSLKLTFPNVIL